MADLVPAHSPLGASGYHRWKACPGSVRLCKGVESESSSFAEQGTRAHALAADVLHGRVFPAYYAGLNQEDFDAVKVYVDYIEGMNGQKWIEEKFDLSKYHPGMFGTADCVVAHTNCLEVIDYKHGAGVAVEVVDKVSGKGNEQLLYYALGALSNFKSSPESIKITIVQPRCYHKDGPIRSWITTPLAVLDFLADLVTDARATEAPDAPLNPGPQCRWCPAAGFCPAVKKKSLEAAKEAFGGVATDNLSELLGKIPIIEDWCKSVREYAYQEARKGRPPTGYKLVKKRVHRRWADGFKPDHEFPQEHRHFFEEKMKSPAQVEKTYPKQYWEMVNKFVLAESSGETLVPCSDDRKEFDSIKEAFKIEG